MSHAVPIRLAVVATAVTGLLIAAVPTSPGVVAYGSEPVR
jgi:hypothetical protein